MTSTQSEIDALVSECSRRVTESRSWTHRRTITSPHFGILVSALTALYRDITGEALESETIRWSMVDFGFDRVDEAVIDEGGVGVLVLSAPRGFMPGVGQTLTFHVVTPDVCVEFEDYWEDNIGDPVHFDFKLRALSDEALDRAEACVRARLVSAAGSASGSTDAVT